MLFHPLFLQGIAALKALLLHTTGPAAAQDQNVLGRRTVGAIGSTMAFASTSSMVIYNPPGDPPLYELMVPPPMNLIVWEPVSKMCLDWSRIMVETGSGRQQFEEASTSLPATKSYTAEAPVKSKRVASPFEYWWVPKIDWSTPGVPTVKAREVKKTPAPDATHIDVWFFDSYIGTEDSILPDEIVNLDPALRVPTVPDDSPPPLWRYQAPELRFERVVLRKGVFPDVGAFKTGFIMAARFDALIYTLWVMGSWLLPIPRYIRRAWRSYRRSKRPLRTRRHRSRSSRRQRDLGSLEIRPGDACEDVPMHHPPPPVLVWSCRQRSSMPQKQPLGT